jgi:urease accessory protein
MRAVSVKSARTWSGEPADRVVLDYDDRHRRRMTMTGAKGTAFLLDLPTATELRGGDALVLEDGSLIAVVAAPEALLEIRCADALHLARVAWHLGNRHLPTQLLPDALRIRRDHVIADMARQLGAEVGEISAPFDPEGGAYAGTAGHHHMEHDGHRHGHGQGHHERDHD